MTLTPRDLHYNGYTSILLTHADGEHALYIRDEYLAGNTDTPGAYALCDTNMCVPIDADADLEAEIAAWKRAVEWDGDTDTD